MTTSIQEQLTELNTQAVDAIASTNSLEELEQLRVKYLGKKGQLSQILRGMGKLSAEERPAVGSQANVVKEKVQTNLEQRKQALQQAKIEAQIRAETIDVTMPGVYRPLGRVHPLNGVVDRVLDIFVGLGYTVSTGPQIETDYYNFEALNTPPDHPARDMQDTFYVRNAKDMLLRTHTSSVQARTMTTQQPPIRIIAPGRVYRNETISARSHCQFHQVEGLYIDEGVSFADMKQTLLYFAKEMYGEQTEIRLRPSYFPFTEPSAEMDVWMGTDTPEAYRLTKGTGWLEVLGCGMVDPAVLDNCGIDSKKYSGFAFGIGIERTALQKYGISDIRYLFENDVRLMKQFSGVM